VGFAIGVRCSGGYLYEGRINQQQERSEYPALFCGGGFLRGNHINALKSTTIILCVDSKANTLLDGNIMYTAF
jgi:hypothetical protein